MNNKAFYTLSYGVYLCTTWDEGRPVGCVANSAMQITSSPATVAVSVNKNAQMTKIILFIVYSFHGKKAVSIPFSIPFFKKNEKLKNYFLFSIPFGA